MTLPMDIEAVDAVRLLSRRRFLQGMGVGTAGLVVSTSWPLGAAFAGTPIAATDGVLVVVTLTGGNDGLNTVVPFGSGAYYDRRGGVSIPAASARPIAPDVGLHPSLGYLKSLYDAGQVAIVRGAGLTSNVSLSHFDSMASWMRGVPGVTGPSTGWIGRWLDGLGSENQVLTAVHIGHEVPLHLLGSERAGAAVAPESSDFGTRTELWEQQFYRSIRELAANPTGLGPWGDAAARRQIDALEVGLDTAPIYGGPLSNRHLVRDFSLAARLVNARVGVRVVSFMQGDFDHHSNQLGQHAALLTDIDDGLRAFFNELTPTEAARTTVMILSEFGRTPGSNASGGTDHGTASDVFLIGAPVAGGLFGAAPSFTDLDGWGRFKATVDFRQVYASVIDHCLGGGSSTVLGANIATLPLFRAVPTAPPPPTADPPSAPGSFIALTPERRLDTRDGIGVAPGALAAVSTTELRVAGVGAIPPTGVTAVVMNVTVTEPAASGFVTVWPTGEPRPDASHLNYTPGQTVPNLVLSKVGVDGKVSVFVSAGPVHAVADVVGYYSTSGGSALVPLSPVRLVDTRPGRAHIGPGVTREVVVTGTAGVPASGVSGVVLNVTVTEPTTSGYLTVWPTGDVRPLASSLNFVAGQTVPNLVTAKVGVGGRVSIYNSSGNSHVVVDIAGYFVTNGEGGRVVVANPTRLLDTRLGSGAFGSGMSRTLTVTGAAVPAAAKAVVLNVTVTEPTRSGYVTVWPNGTGRPEASNLNFVPGQTVPNQVIAAVGSNGQVCIYNSAGSTHIIVDLMGWYI